jgi:glycosyltransferase involved in cell wall biosynthesis
MSPAVRMTMDLRTYGNGRGLPGAFDDLLGQNFPDFDRVVRNRCSNDDILAICKAYAAKDPLFRIYRNHGNFGHSWSSARFVSLAGGQCLRLTSHGDRMAPTRLNRCVQALDVNAHEFPFGDPIAAIGSFIVVWVAFLVRVWLGAPRRQIGARCAGSTCTAVG